MSNKTMNTPTALPVWLNNRGQLMDKHGNPVSPDQFQGLLRLINSHAALVAVCQEALTRNGVDGDKELVAMIKAALALATEGKP
jgi:hypothetical protein